MTNTSVTERVARAIAAALDENDNGEFVSELDATDFDRLARAAISSMPALEEENARLREALQGIVDSWDLNTHQQERFVAESPLGAYWSPAAAMVDSEFIAAARAALSPRKEDQQ